MINIIQLIIQNTGRKYKKPMKTKIIEKIKSFYTSYIKPYRKNLIDPILKILAIIIVCAVLVRVMSGNETLSDYASKNPDIAYSEK